MDNGVDPFTERMLLRARQRHSKQELGKEVLRDVSFPPGSNRNVTVTSTSVDIRKDSHSNKVTIETKVTMKKLPNKNSQDMARKANRQSYEQMETDETDINTEVDSEEENCAPVEEEMVEQQNHPLRPGAMSRLKKLGALYSDDNKLLLSPPIPRTEEHFCVEETENKPSVHPNARSARLAALANTIKQWEDDLSCPSIIKQKADKGEIKSSHYNKDRVFTSGETKNKVFRQIPINSAKEFSCNINTDPQEKGNFGGLTRPSVSQGTDRESRKSTATSKNIIWDKKILDSLEAQGFSRSESNKHLIYDYMDDKHMSSSDIKEEIGIVPNSSPQKMCSDTMSPSKMIPNRNVRCGGSNLDRTDLKITEMKSSISCNKLCNPKMGINQLRSPRKNDTNIPQNGRVQNKVTEYEDSISPTKKVKDPAELPLAERKALFEKNSGSAILPKAPFAMPVPAKTLMPKSSNEITDYSTQKSVTVVHEKGKSAGYTENFEKGISSALHAHLARFAQNSVGDNEKEHMKNVISERQKEMEMLRNRWDRHKELIETNQDALNPSPPVPPPFPSASPLLEKQDEKNSNTSEVKNQLTMSSPGSGYPVVDYVKKIKVSPPKPGRLYPCLSDIEAEIEVTESEENHVDSDNSGISASSEEYSSNCSSSSLGEEIMAVANKSSRSNLKRDWTVDEKSDEDQVLSEIDCFLDEALADQSGCSDEATPPKRSLTYTNGNSGSSHSQSFEYTMGQQKQDMESMESVSYKNEIPKQPLVHSISLYRKQQTLSVKPSSPVRHIVLDPGPDLSGHYYLSEDEQQKESELVDQRIEELQQEVGKQQTIISQASQALNLCCSTIEFSGSTEQVEAERLLLLATHKRQAALHEIQRLSIEGTLRPKGPENSTLQERGNLTISNITLPLKLNIICDAAREEKCFYLVCLVKCGEHVLATNLISTVARSIHDHNKITFPNILTLEGLYSDFKITIEVYTITGRNKEVIPHDIKYHISTSKKDTCKLKLTPRKGKGDSRLVMPTVQSPGGPLAVRSPSFTMAGYVIFSLREVNRTQFTLNKVAYTSVLEGTVHLKIECEMSVDIEHRGFLTMFEDVSGFGAWHRRWCLLKGDSLSYWKYPDDERNKVAIDTIELTSCVTQVVGPVSKDLCARPNTFLLETSRDARTTDIESLVLKSDGYKTTIRHLLSADTKEERLHWCEQLNKALALLRSWGRKQTK